MWDSFHLLNEDGRGNVGGLRTEMLNYCVRECSDLINAKKITGKHCSDSGINHHGFIKVKPSSIMLSSQPVFSYLGPGMWIAIFSQDKDFHQVNKTERATRKQIIMMDHRI